MLLLGGQGTGKVNQQSDSECAKFREQLRCCLTLSDKAFSNFGVISLLVRPVRDTSLGTWVPSEAVT